MCIGAKVLTSVNLGKGCFVISKHKNGRFFPLLITPLLSAKNVDIFRSSLLLEIAKYENSRLSECGMTLTP